MAFIRLTNPQINQILLNHNIYLSSNGHTGARANFTGAHLLKTNFMGRNLSNADFSGAYLNSCVFGSEFATFGQLPNFTGAILRGVNLTGHQLDGIDFTGTDFGGATLQGTLFRRANLSGATFTGARLVGAFLDGANLTGSKIIRANLNGAFIRNAHLEGVDLTGSNCTRVIFRGEPLGNFDKPSNLAKVVLNQTDLEEAELQGVNLDGASLKETHCLNTDLRDTSNLRLDGTFIRGARFSPVKSRLAALLSQYAPFARFFPSGRYNDPWSVLRQLYAGPRLTFIVLSLIAFALPYIGKAALLTSVGEAENRLGAALPKVTATAIGEVERRTNEEIEKATVELEGVIDSLEKEAKSKSIVINTEKFRQYVLRTEVELKARVKEGIQKAQKTITKTTNAVETRVEQRTLWKLLIHWEEASYLPPILAIALIVYNAGIYILVTSVGPLRDEEERSGFSPVWSEYKHLRFVHRGVTALFYVSTAAFVFNLWGILTSEVFVTKF